MSYPVKWFTSTMTNAPVLSGTAGTLIAVLDACLQDGWGSIQASSLTYANGTATFNTANAHNFIVNQIVLIAGASQSEYNGEQKVLTVSTNSFTYAPASAPSVTPATGTITAKVAPAWGSGAKKYSGTNKAVYSPIDIYSNGYCARIDDTGTRDARIVIYETMSDVDTGVGLCPTAAQRSGGNYIPKSITSNTTARKWLVLADTRFVYIFTDFANYTSFAPTMFGEFYSFKNNDQYSAINGCAWDANAGEWIYCPITYYASATLYTITPTYPNHIQRDYTATTQSITVNYQNAAPHFGYSTGYVYPSLISGGLLANGRVFILESSNTRGMLPGMYGCQQKNVTSGSLYSIQTISNKLLIIIRIAKGRFYDGQYDMTMIFDLDAWR